MGAHVAIADRDRERAEDAASEIRAAGGGRWTCSSRTCRPRRRRALLEMQYPFEKPFVVDSTKITDRLDLRATPLDAALEQIRVAGDRAQG